MRRVLQSAGQRLGAVALGSALLLAPLQLARASELFVRTVDGITLVSLAAQEGADTPTPNEAFDRIEKALEVIRRRSPADYRSVQELGGTVVLQYDPDHRALSSPYGALAVFQTQTGIPTIDAADGPSFVAVLGARVVQWPPADLAGIIIHELVGHGRQFAENRIHAMRESDRECEASLYQLRAYQKFGVPTSDSLMVSFRRQLEDVWCRDFSGYLSATWPDARRIWKNQTLDTDRLLVAFQTYRRYGARILSWDETHRTLSSFQLVSRSTTDPSAPSIRGADLLIAYARMLLRRGG